MPGLCYVEQNIFLAHVTLDKTYSRHRLCLTKPIPGICYVRQNHKWDLPVVVKICRTWCFSSKKNNFRNEIIECSKLLPKPRHFLSRATIQY